MKKEITFDKRQFIVFHFMKGMSYSHIARIVNVNRNTVAKVVQRWKKGFENKKRIFRPKIVTRLEARKILKRVKVNSGASKLTAEYHSDTKKNLLLKLFEASSGRKGIMAEQLEKSH